MSKPDYSGTFHMVEQENMDPYLAALGETRTANNNKWAFCVHLKPAFTQLLQLLF